MVFKNKKNPYSCSTLDYFEESRMLCNMRKQLSTTALKAANNKSKSNNQKYAITNKHR